MSASTEQMVQVDPSPQRRPGHLKRLLLPFTMPPRSTLAWYLTITAILASIWGISFTLSKFQMTPEWELFAILVLMTTAMMGGQVIFWLKCPPLLGMLLVGLIWRNFNQQIHLDLASQISSSWSFILRNMAMVVILLRGAFGLNLSILRSRWALVLRLSLIPCLLEAVSWAVGANLLLQFPWMVAFMLGFVMSAASAAVVIPAMLHFAEKGLGVDKGISTITIAATSIDNVVAMSGFGIISSLHFSTGTLLQSIGSIPAQMLIGLTYGVVWGAVLRYVPSTDQRQGHIIAGRLFLLLSGGVVAIFGGHALNYSGAGPLGCLVSGFIANVSWRQQSGWGKHGPNPVSEILAGLWIFFEPLLFGLIGSQIVVAQLDPHLITYGLLIMVLALAIRFCASYVSVMCGHLGAKECVFVAVSWLPKATVQAALGPTMLDTARRLHAGPEAEQMGLDILTLAAISILVLAPIGAIAMKFSGPRLLQKTQLPHVQEAADNGTVL